jgi:CheY-like chemotaxis protein
VTEPARPTVLVVEDDDDTCDLLASSLCRAGYSVQTASNGAEALELLHASTPDVILLDIEMPVMDGAEFRQAQRRDRRLLDIPTIVMTGSAYEPQLDLAVAHTIRKPFRTNDLLTLLAGYCETVPELRRSAEPPP